MRVVPLTVIPEPVKVMSPVAPCTERTPVLLMTGFLRVPETLIPVPPEICSMRFDAVSLPNMSTSLLNLAFSRKKLSMLAVKTKRGFWL